MHNSPLPPFPSNKSTRGAPRPAITYLFSAYLLRAKSNLVLFEAHTNQTHSPRRFYVLLTLEVAVKAVEIDFQLPSVRTSMRLGREKLVNTTPSCSKESANLNILPAV